MPEKTNLYDLTVVIKNGEEKEIAAVEKVVAKLVADNGGKIADTEKLGAKELAYKIEGENYGVYEDLRLELPAPAPAKISSVLNITDGILRYLLVKVDAKAEAWIAENRKNLAKRAAERAAQNESE